MTATAINLPPAIPAPGKVIEITPATWEFYEQLVELPEFHHVRITYDRGRMTLMSPLPIHDKVKKLAGRIIELATLERDVPISSFGSTTWKRKDLHKGLEPDECYYITSEPKVHGRADIDLRKDPPPDLAVEIDITRNPIDRPSVYAALGVAELWRYNGKQFSFVRRTPAGKYEPIPASVELPFMTPQILDRFVALLLKGENAGLREFRNWLREQPNDQETV